MLKTIGTSEYLKAARYVQQQDFATATGGHRVVFLTNFIPPYRLPALRALGLHLGTLKTFVSTSMEVNRSWTPDWQDLDVDIQKSVSVRKVLRHPDGFDQETYVHLPYDTLPKLATFNPDVVISGEMGARTMQAVLYRIATPRSRLIIQADLSEYTERGRGHLRNALRRWMLRHADAVLVNGESGARYVRMLGVPESKIFRVPYATDTSVYLNISRVDDDTNIIKLLHVGQLIERKGIVSFLERLAKWSAEHPKHQLELALVGDGPLRTTIMQFPTPPNLSVRLIQPAAYSAMPEIYSQADLLVLPTLADSWALVVNEAMAAGLPILGSRKSQAVEELVTDGESGWVFSPENSDELYSALNRALSASKETRLNMGAAARITAIGVTPQLVAERTMRAIGYCFGAQRYQELSA